MRSPPIVLISLAAGFACAAGPRSTQLEGTWRAERIYGPEVDGRLFLRRAADGWVAEVGPYTADVQVNGSFLEFSLPSGDRFEASIGEAKQATGFWKQTRSRLDNNVFATPVYLNARGDGWEGLVRPVLDTARFRLELTARADGGLAAELINPERNLGIYQKLSRAVLRGDEVELWGSFRGRGPESVQLRGRYHRDVDVISVWYPWRGGGYDFRRTKAPAGPRDAQKVRLARPLALDDGWATATLADVGMDPEPIRRMIATRIAPTTKSTETLRVHGMVIARRGRLVAETYFRGHHRDRGHDSRSASKSVASILAAAVMTERPSLTWDAPLYALFGRDADAKKKRITLRHAAHMATGLDCDDGNPRSAANEDNLWDNAERLDFYAHTLDTNVVGAPGKAGVYCSASSNLVGGAVAAAAKEDLLVLLHRKVMAPLGIEWYGVPIPPDGKPYFGGGLRFRTRDFLKFPQLLLQGGEWSGRRIMSAAHAKRLLTPEVKIGKRDYGFLFWSSTYPYGDGTVRAHMMAGNGGQIAVLVPELDLAIAFNAGNYGHRAAREIQNDLIPNYIIAAVKRSPSANGAK